jgi:hypothetical protein
MPRHSATVACALSLAAALVVPSAPGHARDGSTARTTDTAFALSASGFGSRLQGGDLPTGSGKTAYQHIGCTNRAGLSRTNAVAEQDVPGLGTLSGLETHVWTTRHHGVVASHARHTIAALTLADLGPLGSLSVTGITSDVTAFHDAQGFQTVSTPSVGSVSLTVLGSTQAFDPPTPGNPVTVPGVATLSIGPSSARTGLHSAAVTAYGLKVDVIPTDTHAKLARAQATIADGVTFGLFHGRSAATQVSALDDTLSSGPNPLTLMPCQGTGGQLRAKSTAHVTLAGALDVTGLRTSERARQSTARAHGFEQAKVAHLDLGGGAVVVHDIVGRATVTRSAHDTTRSARGTTVGSVTVNGVAWDFPRSGVIEVPGVARLETRLVKRSRSGLSVTALRITLLDGSGAVIDLGRAQLKVSKLHRR